MLGLSRGQLGGHGRRVRRDQAALRHLQLGSLPSAHTYWSIAAGSANYRACCVATTVDPGQLVSAEVSAVSVAVVAPPEKSEINWFSAPSTPEPAAPKTDDPGRLTWIFCPVGVSTYCNVVISGIVRRRRIGSSIERERRCRSLASAKQVLPLVARVRKRKHLIANPAQLLSDAGDVARIERPVIARTPQ